MTALAIIDAEGMRQADVYRVQYLGSMHRTVCPLPDEDPFEPYDEIEMRFRANGQVLTILLDADALLALPGLMITDMIAREMEALLR